ncbi:MAG: MBL fold metallo-hydrolase [Parachlamydiaceae bacterium]|nr:MBL fold metallo-hydrolase [Parachlamydiaceae bacterium]
MARINLIRVKDNSYYCNSIFSIGVYIKDNMAVLIDSGISKEVAKEVDKSLSQINIHVAAIINTHCHGDHCGGNAFFQQKYPQIKIFCTETERPFIEDPLMAPICFCGGAAAFEELKKCKPIAPQQASKVTDIIAPYVDQKIFICGETFEIITLPGHTRGMIAVKTPDNVLYCGDAIFGDDTFKKYPILYYTFIGDTLKSFKKLRALIPSIDATVIYHGGLIPDIIPLIDDHEKRILETKNKIFSMLCEQPLSLEEITAKIMQTNDIPDDVISYVLTKTPMQAYIAELQYEKLIEIRVTNGVNRAHLIENGVYHQSQHYLSENIPEELNTIF